MYDHTYIEKKNSYQLWYSLLASFSEQKATIGGWDHLAYYLCRIIDNFMNRLPIAFLQRYHCYWYKLINQYHIGELLCKTIFPHLGYDDMNIANPELMMKRALLFHCFRLYYITFTFLCYLDGLFHYVSKMLKSISHFIHKPNGGYLFILLFSVYELDGVPSETTRFFRQLAEGLAIPQKKKYRKNIPYKTNSSNIVGKCKDILRFKIN